MLCFVLTHPYITRHTTGLVCSTFYHFFVHDQTGPIGLFLRRTVYSLPCIHHHQMDMNDEMFAIVTVSVFMQIIGILQMPHFLGPSFNPFEALVAIVKNTLWIDMDQTLNVVVPTTTLDKNTNNKCPTAREDASVLIPGDKAVTAELMECSITTTTTVATVGATTKDASGNGTLSSCVMYNENGNGNMTLTKGMRQRCIQK